MNLFFKNYHRNIIIIAVIMIIIIITTMIYLAKKSVSTYLDNFIVAITCGLLFSIITFLFGLTLGKKFEEKLFLYRTRDVLISIKKLRTNGILTSEQAQSLVIKITNTYGDEILNGSLLKKNRNITEVNDCGVCGKKVEVEDKRCINCKLNCFAWDNQFEIK